MSQSFVNLAAGNYTLTYWLSPTNGASGVTTGSSSVIASLGGVSAAARTFTSFTNLGGTVANYAQYTETFTLTTTAAGALTFSYTRNSCVSLFCALVFDDVSLTFAAAPTTLTPTLPSGAPANASNVTTAIDSFGGTLPTGFASLSGMTGTQLQAAASQLSGEPGASSTQAGVSATTQFMNTMFDAAFDNATSAGFGLSYAAENGEPLGYTRAKNRSKEAHEAYAAVTPRDRVVNAYAPRWNVWGSVYGGNSRTSGDAALGSNTLNSRAWGLVTGADYKLTPNTRVGFAIGGGSLNYGVDNGLGGGKADMFQVGAYAKHNVGAAYLAGALAYAWQNNTTDRTVTVFGTDNLRASFNSHAFAARLEGGWRFETPAIGVTPYAALQSTSFYLPSYGETATSGLGTFALNYTSRTVTATRSELGARWDKQLWTNGGTTFALKARTAWAHDWNTDRTATAAFQSLPGASSFVVNGAAPSSNSFLLSLGGGFKFEKGWSLLASYEGEYSRNTVSNAGKGTLKYEW